jgi:hypothetical protein
MIPGHMNGVLWNIPPGLITNFALGSVLPILLSLCYGNPNALLSLNFSGGLCWWID